MKLGTILASNAVCFPDRPAMLCDGARISWGELDRAANRMAHALIGAGLAVGDRVAVSLPNGIELVSTVCGILKAGGIVVPVSTRLTPAEVAVIVEDCAPRALIYGAEQRDTMLGKDGRGAVGAARFVVGARAAGESAVADVMSGGNAAPPPPLPVDPDDALIGYTSGTTGKPKGAISTHANLVIGQGIMTAREWGLAASDVIFATTPMAHRTGIARIANAVCLGATLVTTAHFDAARAIDIIAETGVTVIGCVPTIARMLLPHIAARPEACARLRVMVATGEAFPDELQTRLTTLVPGLRIYGFYSQTEAGFVASLSPEDRQTHPHSVGRAVPGVELRIVDAGLRDVPAGEPGEILVRCGRPGQYSVMRAYFNRPQATDEAFVDGWLRTGDIGRLDQDGYLTFVDRAKDMIISGGLNIYSREVEIALAAHPAVADAAVIGVPDAMFGEAVMACIELKRGAEATADDLIEHCRALIASYKKPKHVRFVASLPRNATGKVMKAELRKTVAEGDRP